MTGELVGLVVQAAAVQVLLAQPAVVLEALEHQVKAIAAPVLQE
jgi:hypothetical protein